MRVYIYIHQKDKTLLIMSILLCSVAFLWNRSADLGHTVTLSWYFMLLVVYLYDSCLTCE